MGLSMGSSMESLLRFDFSLIDHVTLEWSIEGLACYQFGGACDGPLTQ
jgi:hypothetical protein